jgi:hypothetical protein
MTKNPNLRQQAEAVALAAVNLHGHIDNLVGLVAKGQRPQWELDHCRRQYPALNAAASTLEILAAKEQTKIPAPPEEKIVQLTKPAS